MGDHTKADLAVIQSMGDGLSKVHSAFKEIAKLNEKYDDDIGHDGLSDTVGDFADNWDKSREKLMGDVDRLAQIAKAAAQAYDDFDGQLADALRSAQEPQKGK